MMEINVKFLGIPTITIDNNILELPYSKAECILYMLLFEKQVSRDMLSSILWGDMNDKSAKKNLRNAIYIIRKNTFEDIIQSPKRSILEINENYAIVSDIDYIQDFDPCDSIELDEIEKFLNVYNGHFLEELKLKADSDFVEWIDKVDVNIHAIYINKLKNLSNLLIQNQEYFYSELCCRKLIELEEYDEIGYANLMKIYLEKNKFEDAIEVYTYLVEKLNKDLSVKTSRETDEVYEKVMKKINLKSSSKTVSFYGRENEKQLLYDNIYNFIGNKAFKSFIISGEDGIGKSLLLNDIVHDFDFNILLIKINCYEYETDFIFKFWDKVFQQVSNSIKEIQLEIPKNLINIISKIFPTLDIDLKEDMDTIYNVANYDYAEKAIFDLFGLLSSKMKIMFVVDDLNYADKASLELLYKTILANRYKIMLIASNKEDNNIGDDKFYSSLKYNNIIDRIRLNRFNMEETKEFVKLIEPEAIGQIQSIYSESEGNPLFIMEIINNIKNGEFNTYMTNKIENLIQGRLVGLTDEANKLLSICSLFHDVFYIEMLTKITDIKSLELVDIIDELLSKEILREVISGNNKLGLIFTHGKIVEYVYKNISNSKRIILHAKIAEYYEDELKNNINTNRTLYPEMIHHFSSSNNKCKLFKYKVRWLEEILNFKHEIFPVTGDYNSGGLIEYYLDEDSLEKEFKELKELYFDLRCARCKSCIEEEILYLYLFGRFNKNRGHVEEGLEYLNEMIIKSEENQFFQHAYNGYLQLAHYYVNIDDMDLMGKAIGEAERVSELLNDSCKMAVVWRLKGFYYIVKREFENGEEYISRALEVFLNPENKEKYMLNIVASMFYLGESFRYQGMYDEALDSYDKSLDLCGDSEDCPAAALIFSKIGYIKYKQNNLDEAQFYYLKALKAYEKTIFAWGRTEVYYYLYKIYKNKGILVKANKYLNDSLKYVDKYTSKELKDKIYSIVNSK